MHTNNMSVFQGSYNLGMLEWINPRLAKLINFFASFKYSPKTTSSNDPISNNATSKALIGWTFQPIYRCHYTRDMKVEIWEYSSVHLIEELSSWSACMDRACWRPHDDDRFERRRDGRPRLQCKCRTNGSLGHGVPFRAPIWTEMLLLQLLLMMMMIPGICAPLSPEEHWSAFSPREWAKGCGEMRLGKL